MIFRSLYTAWRNRRQYRQDFFLQVSGLLAQEPVQRLDTRIQHFKVTRLRHSIDVAYYSYFLARAFGWNYASAAKAGLLHDLFFHEAEQTSYQLLHSHPVAAVANAKTLCPLSSMEENIILGHMWPFSVHSLESREGYLVSLMDKYSTIREGIASLLTRRKRITAQPLYLVTAVTPIPESVGKWG